MMETSELEIEVLIHQLQTGSVFQKCAAADNLALLGPKAIKATNALVEAMSDLSQDSSANCGWHGADVTYYYVRVSAVNALAKINPYAAAARALQVISELGNIKSQSSFIATWGENDKRTQPEAEMVIISDDVIAAFAQAAGVGKEK
jgi:HEAT repeat protein